MPLALLNGWTLCSFFACGPVTIGSWIREDMSGMRKTGEEVQKMPREAGGM